MSKFILSILVISLTVVTAVAQVHKRVPAVVGAEKNMTYRHSANHHRLGNENIARAAKSASAQKMKPDI